MQNLYFIIFIFYFGFTPASATEFNVIQPSYEFGAGFSIVDIPHYAGSEQSKTYLVPFPYFNYQSEKISLNREGLKRHLFISNYWKIDMSFSGTIPIKSKQNNARQGMPDLDWVGLAGPAINYQITQTENSFLNLNIPLRFGFATDFSQVDYVGWEVTPALQWISKVKTDLAEWKIITSVGLNYANRDYNAYYYSVDDKYSNSERASYNAQRGYAGYKLTLGVNRKQGDFWFGAFLRYRNISDAEFEDSPLVTAKANFYTGIAFAWIIKSTKT